MVLKILVIGVLTLAIIGCKDSTIKADESDTLIEKTHSICIKTVLEKDSIWGEIRNHSSKITSLSESINNYAQSMQSLDFSSCPNDFKDAYKKHIEAWLDIRTVSDKYPALRGELHDIFTELDKSRDSTMFKQLVLRIWDTWELVEHSAN